MSQDEDIAYGHIVQQQLDADWAAAEEVAGELSSLQEKSEFENGH